jgi:group I intron endonuclease
MDLPTTGGIYMLQNTDNGRIYIGQTCNIRCRVRKHFEALRRNKHKNSKLQNSFNTHGENSFAVFVLNENIPNNELDAYEQTWLDMIREYHPEFVYNICFEPNTTRGYKFTDEQRIQHSARQKGLIQSDTHVKRRIASSMETKRKIGSYKSVSDKLKKSFDIISPDGVMYHVCGLIDFAKQHDLSAGPLSMLLNGKLKQHKGWKLYNLTVHDTLGMVS